MQLLEEAERCKRACCGGSGTVRLGFGASEGPDNAAAARRNSSPAL